MAITLSSIRKTTQVAAPRLLIYGVAGVGKTSLAASSPSPIFIFTEDGAGALNVESFTFGGGETPRPYATAYQEIIEALTALYLEDHSFKTVVIDSIDGLEPLVWAHTAAMHGKTNIEDWDYGKGYAFAAPYWQTLLDGLNALRDKRGMSVILLGHAQSKPFNDPLNDTYDRYSVKLHKGASALIQEAMDGVFFYNYRVFTKKEDLGFNKTSTRGLATGERVLGTRECPGYVAKNRYSLPPEISVGSYPANPWDSVQNAIIAGVMAHRPELAF